MSIIRIFDKLNEENVVCFSSEGDERVYIPLCGVTHCLPDYYIERFVSPECVFEYIISGHGIFHTGDQEFHPGPDDVYIAHRGSRHFYRTDTKDRWVKIWFNIQGSLIDELLRIYGLENVNYIPQSNLQNLFSECLGDMRTHPDNAHEVATLTAHKLVYGISRQLYEGANNVNPIALELKKWMEHNAIGTMNLARLSHIFGYSKSQLIRIFQQEYHETPYQFFLKKKLDLAMIMLQNTQKTIKEIADELNFADPYYFSNLFKRKFGKCPASVRRKS